jgi:hypothetical protein
VKVTEIEAIVWTFLSFPMEHNTVKIMTPLLASKWSPNRPSRIYLPTTKATRLLKHELNILWDRIRPWHKGMVWVWKVVCQCWISCFGPHGRPFQENSRFHGPKNLRLLRAKQCRMWTSRKLSVTLRRSVMLRYLRLFNMRGIKKLLLFQNVAQTEVHLCALHV